MKHEVNITDGIKVGGMDYEIDVSPATCRLLIGNNNAGECDCRNKVIRLDVGESPQSVSKTFIHEVIEAVNHIYCNDKIEHERITQLGYGIHQVMECLGVRFGKYENLWLFGKQ